MFVYYLDEQGLLRYEMIQAQQEGKDISGIDENLQGEAALLAIDEIQKRPTVPGYKYDEPNDLEEIRKRRPKERWQGKKAIDKKGLADRIYGAWLGRAAGCWLGKPWEGYGFVHGWKGIRPFLEELNEYPLNRYIDLDLDDKFLDKHGIFPELKGYRYDQFDGMPEDDDMNYPVIGLVVLERHGRNFTSIDVANVWMDYLPVLRTCTAERVAYRNWLNGIGPNESGYYRNPYREFIGAQIRADFWGYINPGDPETAAEYAYRDAATTHTKNGIYGEMFIAAALAVALVSDSVDEVIAAGLGEIPENCRLAEAIRDIVKCACSENDFENILDYIITTYNYYDPVHTINNALIVVAALIYGKKDYSKTVGIAVMGGWDADCNGATAGSIAGAMVGAKAIPEHWLKPMNDILNTGVQGYNRVKLSDLAKKTLDLVCE